MYILSLLKQDMTKKETSGILNALMWIVQVMLSVSLFWAAWTKLFTPIVEIAQMWPWTGEVSPNFVKFTGLIDLLGGLGLVIPPLFQMNKKLVPLAAIGIVLLMISASAFHIMRGEASQIGFNLIFAALTAFVAWGRLSK